MLKVYAVVMFIIINGMYHATHGAFPPYGDMLTSAEYTITTYIQGL